MIALMRVHFTNNSLTNNNIFGWLHYCYYF